MGLALARDGAAVVINYRGNPDRARATVLEIEGAGGTAIAAEADVRSAEAAGKLVKTTVDQFGRVDILVNNAGVSEDGVSWKLGGEAWKRTIDANLTAAFFCIQAALVPMREQGYGRIVNISSVVGQVGVPGDASGAVDRGDGQVTLLRLPVELIDIELDREVSDEDVEQIPILDAV